MKQIWDTCDETNITIPDEVMKFFNYDSPGDKPGMEVDLADSTKKWSDSDMCEGYEIDISKIPADVKFIRVMTCY